MLVSFWAAKTAVVCAGSLFGPFPLQVAGRLLDTSLIRLLVAYGTAALTVLAVCWTPLSSCCW